MGTSVNSAGQMPKTQEKTAIEMLLEPIVRQLVIKELEGAFNVYQAVSIFDEKMCREVVRKFLAEREQAQLALGQQFKDMQKYAQSQNHLGNVLAPTVGQYPADSSVWGQQATEKAGASTLEKLKGLYARANKSWE